MSVSVQDLRNFSSDELKLKIAEEKKIYNKLKMSHKVSAIEKPLSIQLKRRLIARMNTILREKL